MPNKIWTCSISFLRPSSCLSDGEGPDERMEEHRGGQEVHQRDESLREKAALIADASFSSSLSI